METMTSHHLVNTDRKNPLPRIYLLIGFIAVVTIGSMGFIFYLGNRMVAGKAPLINAAMEIKLEATKSHLWFEEIISGDRYENIDDVLKHIDQADWYATAMIEGGKNAEGKLDSLENTWIQHEVIAVQEKLADFRKITLKRLQSQSEAGIDTEIDQQYHSVFRDCIAQADLVETELRRLIQKDLATFWKVQTALITVCLTVTVLVGLIFSRFIRGRIRYEQTLQFVNQQLAASEHKLRANEQELRRQRDRTQSYLDVAGVMLIVIDREQRVIMINKKGCEILGYDERDILGKNWFDLFIPVKLRDKAGEAFLKSMSGEIELIKYDEHPVLTKESEERLIAWHNSVIRNDQGCIVGIISSGADITERKLAEQALKASKEFSEQLVETANAVIIVLGTDGKITNFNRFAEDLTGYKKEDVLGKNWFDLFVPEEERDAAIEIHKQVIEDNLEVSSFEYFIVTKVSKKRLINWNNNSLKDNQGEVIGTISIGTDITLQKQTQDALIKSEEKYRLLYEDAPIGYQSLDADGNFLEVNREWLRILMYSKEEVIGKFFADFVAPEYIEPFMENFDLFKANGKTRSTELEMVCKNGSHITASFDGNIETDTEGHFRRTHCIMHDITDRKKAEENLAIFKRFTETSAQGMSMTNLEGKIVYCNKAMCRTFFEEEETQKTFGKHISYYYDAKSALKLQEQILPLVRETGRWTGEMPIASVNGKVTQAIQSIFLMHNDKGEPAYLAIVVTDITERKKAEEALRESNEHIRLLLNSTAEAIYGVDIEGNCTFCNPACLKILGYEYEGQLLGKNLHELIHHTRPDGSEYPMEECQVCRAYKLGQGIHVDDEVLWRVDGTCFPTDYRSYPVRREGEIVGSVVTFLDITERKTREKRLSDYRNRLQSLVSELTMAEDRERKNIASMLHDDVLQKLALSKMKLSMLRESLTSVDQIESLDSIHDCVGEMFKDMRSLTFDLCPLILYDIGLEAAVRDWLQREVADKHSIEVDLGTEGQSLQLDNDLRVALFRATREVLMNAIKHAQAQKICVTIANLNDTVRIEIQDDGIGFEQPPANAGKGYSSGIGLFTVRERLEHYGGSVEIESKSGNGTRVVLTAAVAHGQENIKETEEIWM